MYRLKAGDTEYTIPKENIGMLAYVKAKAKDNGDIIDPRNIDGAIFYLRSLGIMVSEYE